MDTIKVLNNKNITDVPYFKAIGVASGIKGNNKSDLCVIYSEKPCIAAGTFTTNKVKAAPVLLDLKHIESENIYAIVANSGNANACTGDDGYEKAYLMAECTAKHLKIKPEEVLVASTGVIGVPLPIDKVMFGIEKAFSILPKSDANKAIDAIMTTDTVQKKIFVEFMLDKKKVTICAIAKGSGMIHPNMATMLSFIVTDANITKDLLNKALKESVKDSYNMISVDRDTSTNDMALLLANGASGNTLISSENSDYEVFKKALHYVNVEISKMIAKDGEGATKLIEAKVFGASSSRDAKVAAKSVITSNLVKAAVFGSDANWGRIICALGYSAAEIDPSKVDISFSNNDSKVETCLKGTGLNFDEEAAKKILDGDHVIIEVNLNNGKFNATAWGCDLTYDYVKINGSYRS
ncbi:glutamate N-acetyltransferase/amino-acid N-acetyltransferase [Clostridium acetobutylicum]|uniref:Arginine biosynthesis bifunctional protein ArgJ 1 n=1 Tax=Clostridium acetobutylicum (strain ATCC 824 / DSM 792 / JCM 1419 / IAM 19013 / LMG 5710 / NBRC 13948 / NRRL B-527 / VKM B-1787 / 2291 / W) TaxID=272562 RepID=ARGJ1_CLOAB|nr:MULTISPECIES: bifunctional glutamate N-acetyltransferase/amino-acid acetyltransferase ArgJ [Clostridium]Q97GH6.1 RecName: Full=Arginine biosynthesis bifunctional protein ArgJ 1; Includes: RecName: Full=Glutamate N-acetyltransferase; AltName: Full=Ornithine acetyltransferase; Short=OATase; AltName: Full=Ornithine transacetylase; Includes: RecName: Full=Amino-acid acetyltransferase; AltName: Full=N-acetylglutamate synthase; Short=AGSase; Contains: RecName: Full=Arginine biosynthesis bifunctional 